VLFEPQSIIACTISRDVQKFDLLIEDMGQAAGDRWGDVPLEEAAAFLARPDAGGLDFLVLALDSQDEGDLDRLLPVVASARARGIRVILVAEDVSPAALHRLLREGADDFVPYPLPEGELARILSRPRGPRLVAASPAPEAQAAPAGGRSGVVIPVYSMAGGAGGTTLAVNLAWELASLDTGPAPRVCLLDLGLQFGSVATLLDLPRREAVLELLSSTDGLDGDAFQEALQLCGDRLHVFTAPADLVPLDLIDGADAERLIGTARLGFDYVVIDMPPALADWSEAVLQAAHLCFAVIQLDMRSAQNTLRLKRALTSEGLPFGKIRFALNRAPGFSGPHGAAGVKRLAESLGISIDSSSPTAAGRERCADQGVPWPRRPKNRSVRDRQARPAGHEVNLASGAAQKARPRLTARGPDVRQVPQADDAAAPPPRPRARRRAAEARA
jgi:pilus assembly protein CpaE